MSKQRFLFCKHCKNLVTFINDEGPMLTCCGEKMAELDANTIEASVEKHLPVVTSSINGIKVQVGSTPHPMEEAHHIVFVYVETERGGQLKRLNINEKPEAEISFINDKPIAVYAYCNIHGLWVTEIK